MVEGLMKLVAKELRRLADKFDAGTTEASESQVMDILNMLTHVPMSKAQACSYLNLSRSRFDDLVREKKLPKGRKNVGDSLKKSGSWQKGRGSELNFAGCGESKRQLQRKR